MDYTFLRKELREFYQDNNEDRTRRFSEKCNKIFDKTVSSDLPVIRQKLMQYEIIAREFEPVIFKSVPFYFETGTMVALSDGAFRCKGTKGLTHAGGMTYLRNKHVFEMQDPALWKRVCAQKKELLYLICGPYNDTMQHFNFNNRPILQGGLKGIYEEAKAALRDTTQPQEQEFLQAVCEAMLILRSCAEKFAQSAEALLETETDPAAKETLLQISRTARTVPWEAPRSFYEALCTLAFMRKMIGTMEGVGPNTFGRPDMDLYPFYQMDLEEGRLTPSQGYDLICRFLLIWDCHYDHDMKMVGYADHELENTYTIGGCDAQGQPLCNDLTLMFLRATREHQIIFPKIKCRFSANSDKEYLQECMKSVLAGTTTVLFQNDDACIPALIQAGRTEQEARDYIVTGCWGMTTQVEKTDHGAYLNLLKPFEFALHGLQDKMDAVGISFLPYDGAESFEQVYEITVENCARLIHERLDISRKGAHVWHRADALPIFSSTLATCLSKKQDFTLGGGKYRDDFLLCFGLPNIVDSLMAIRTLCFEKRLCSLAELLTAVRADWQGYDALRRAALSCSGWGDGKEESTALARRFNDDLHRICSSVRGTYGGRVLMGHLTYTEIRWWGEQTLATPDGRHNGDYFSQGLTPSRLKKIPFISDVVNSLAGLDGTKMAANNVVNLNLPAGMGEAHADAFLRTVAGTAAMCLQLNHVTREQLLAAQQNPEEYTDLIVRVCGFSARFTSLSPEWQQEVLSRNFFDA